MQAKGAGEIAHSSGGRESAGGMTRHLAGLRPRLLLVVFLPWLAALVYIAAIDRRFEREADAEIAQALAYSLRIANAEQFALAENARNFLLMLDAFTRATTASSGEPCRRALAELHRQHPQFQNFGFLDARGEILCAALPKKDGVSFAGLEFVTDAVKLGTMSMSNYQLGPVTNLPQIGFALPLRDAGKEVTRLLFVTTHLNILRNRFDPNRLPAGYDLIVTDTASRLVFAHPPRPELVGRELPDGIDFRARPGNSASTPFTRQGLDGDVRLARASSLEVGSGRLHLSVGLPRAMVTARAWELRQTEVITFTMIGLGALLLTWYAAELLILAKLRTIRGTIELWAQGDLQARTDIAPGRGELRQLAGDLDAMAAALASLARRHTLILDAAGEGIYGLDNNACVNFVNPAAAALLG
jgi:PAS domain-containing protein